MTCKECNTRNPIGNKFCRECGKKIVIPEGSLAAEEAERAEAERKAERAAVLLADAHLLADQGKYLGAIPIVEEAIILAPFSVSAYSLLVTLYEHTDQMERAVSTQSRLVEMHPDTPAEATRLERLKRGERTTPPPARVSAGGAVPTLRGTGNNAETTPLFPNWFPAAAAVTCGAAALFLGYIAVTPRGAIQGKPKSEIAPVVVEQNPEPVNTIPMNPNATLPPKPDVVRGGDPFVSLDATRRALQAQTAQRTGAALPAVPTSGAAVPLKNLTGTRPPSVPGATRTSASNQPVVVGIVKGGTGASEENTPLETIAVGPPAGSSSNAGTERISAAPPAPEVAATPRPSTGYMRIQVNNNPPPIAATAPSNTSSDMDGDPLRRARALQRLERYSDAIAAFREAIAAGSSAGDAYQNIAICYQHLGDMANAKSAYQQAISAYEGQIKSGRSASAALRGKQSCEAALEVLGG